MPQMVPIVQIFSHDYKMQLMNPLGHFGGELSEDEKVCSCSQPEY